MSGVCYTSVFHQYTGMVTPMSIDPELKKKIEQSLRVSRWEGVPAAVMLGITEYYLTPLGLLLGATTQQIGFLVAVPHLLASFSQLFAVRALNLVGSRRKFIIRMAALQALVLIPIALLPLVTTPGRVLILIGLVAVFRVLANLIGPPWGRMPVGRFASNSVRPRGGAPIIDVPLDPMVGGPLTSASPSDAGTAVPVIVW